MAGLDDKTEALVLEEVQSVQDGWMWNFVLEMFRPQLRLTILLREQQHLSRGIARIRSRVAEGAPRGAFFPINRRASAPSGHPSQLTSSDRPFDLPPSVGVGVAKIRKPIRMPDLSIVYRPVAALQPYAKNAR